MTKFSVVALFWALFAGTAHSDIAWPDPSIPIPGNVRTFIVSECVEYQGWSEETVSECIKREKYGYRAVVTMLMDKELGERAAERYRGCTVGLGKIGGRFHRRKAVCISKAYQIVWRFEYSEETSLQRLRKAELEAPPTPSQRDQAFRLASSFIEESYKFLP